VFIPNYIYGSEIQSRNHESLVGFAENIFRGINPVSYKDKSVTVTTYLPVQRFFSTTTGFPLYRKYLNSSFFIFSKVDSVFLFFLYITNIQRSTSKFAASARNNDPSTTVTRKNSPAYDGKRLIGYLLRISPELRS